MVLGGPYFIMTPHVVPQLLLPFVALIALCTVELGNILHMGSHVFIEVRSLVEALIAQAAKMVAHLGMN